MWTPASCTGSGLSFAIVPGAFSLPTSDRRWGYVSRKINYELQCGLLISFTEVRHAKEYEELRLRSSSFAYALTHSFIQLRVWGNYFFLAL